MGSRCQIALGWTTVLTGESGVRKETPGPGQEESECLLRVAWGQRAGEAPPTHPHPSSLGLPSALTAPSI